MSSTEVRNDPHAPNAVVTFDMKLEVVVIPVSDVERAKEFYSRLGWRLDATPPGVIQFTPPGSACSVQFGANLTSAAPGSLQRTYLVVSDIVGARSELVAAGLDVSELFHLGPDGPSGGPDPERQSYRSLMTLSDPDGNSWLFQEITTRLPGRVEADATTYGSADDLSDAMRRASVAHGEHEQRTGQADANWPDWYAAYMVAEQSGAERPT
jgi:catechol 2,3-dioxygenase-like lactoylglutathione lyase family enzyme